MELQSFVTKVIESIGGIVDPMEYALCQVLIPEEYSHYFQNRSEIVLSFDYEVAQENPQSEFITFGSYIFQQVMTLAHRTAVNTVRFAEVERLTLANPIKKITDYLKDEPGKLSINNERHILGAWAVYQFQVVYVSDEKEENTYQIWIDLITGEVAESMRSIQNSIIFKNDPLYTYPVPDLIDTSTSFEMAYKSAKAHAENISRERLDLNLLKKDLHRIETYYDELLKENNKRATRKGISEEKKKEIASKSKATELERDKQIQEMKNKYDVRIEIMLEHGIFYFVPLIEFEVTVNFRGESRTKMLYYNPITKQFTEGRGDRNHVPAAK
jgi:hypothetical protein